MRGFVLKFIKFSGIAVAVYLLVIAILSNTTEPMLFNGHAFTNVPLNRPGGGLSVLRFQEAENFGKVDVLFLGSSHCYRTFDTAWYADQGIRAFNLGSTAQAPLISYHLAPHYLKKLDPDLVVLEVYSETLRSNSAESLLDQLTNRPLDFGLLKMTAAVGGVKAWNGFLVHLLNFTDEDISKRTVRQKPANGLYVSGGFVRRDLPRGGIMDFSEPRIPVSGKQLKYLEKLIELVQKQGRKIILVGQPLPEKTLKTISDYGEIHRKVSEIASDHGVVFMDFNGTFEPEGPGISGNLHQPGYFYDYHHLNPAGVAAFNPAFLSLLKKDGWL